MTMVLSIVASAFQLEAMWLEQLSRGATLAEGAENFGAELEQLALGPGGRLRRTGLLAAPDGAAANAAAIVKREPAAGSGHDVAGAAGPHLAGGASEMGVQNGDESAATAATAGSAGGAAATAAGAAAAGGVAAAACADGWRVKLYQLNSDGQWDAKGTGYISCKYIHAVEATALCVVSEVDGCQLLQLVGARSPGTFSGAFRALAGGAHISASKNDFTLPVPVPGSPPCAAGRGAFSAAFRASKVSDSDVYRRQGDNIITWCEPVGLDLALSFQENQGCMEIWSQITDVQGRKNSARQAAELRCPVEEETWLRSSAASPRIAPRFFL
ncbi:hypothetical protein JKP88DRAFT_352181 [Tribonema minus]|uniref:PP4R3 EVH1-like domain-containing protein n=1 Tax=Tribonema minus TaxID=303371 RepID=A0A836CM72_9STRA|nr:hypothetical protein JKP88DRAFT_352181 [Tribonema minus]